MPSTVKLHPDRLRCIVESDEKGASEPYLWVTYFCVDGRNVGRPEPVTTVTPVYDGFRTEFPDNVSDGTVVNVPSFLANCSLEVDPGPLGFMLAGVVVVLWEEDETPNKAIRAGRNAFLTGMHEQLNQLIRQRIAAFDARPVTPDEVAAISLAIEPSVESAIRSNLSWWEKLTGNQDDLIGFAHVAFSGSEIRTRDFTFPEIADESRKNRFVLSGRMTVEPTRPTFDRCAAPRAAVVAKHNQISALHTMRTVLQQQLQTAPPQAKAAIVAQIAALGDQIVQAEAELAPLQAALASCENRFRDLHGDLDEGVLRQ